MSYKILNSLFNDKEAYFMYPIVFDLVYEGEVTSVIVQIKDSEGIRTSLSIVRTSTIKSSVSSYIIRIISKHKYQCHRPRQQELQR